MRLRLIGIMTEYAISVVYIEMVLRSCRAVSALNRLPIKNPPGRKDHSFN